MQNKIKWYNLNQKQECHTVIYGILRNEFVWNIELWVKRYSHIE